MGLGDFIMWPKNAVSRQVSTGPGKVSLLLGVIFGVFFLATFWVMTNTFRNGVPSKTDQGAEIVEYSTYRLPKATSAELRYPTFIICPRWNYWNNNPVQDIMSPPRCRAGIDQGQNKPLLYQLINWDKTQQVGGSNGQPCYVYNVNGDTPGLGSGQGPMVPGQNWTKYTQVWCTIANLTRNYDYPPPGHTGDGFARFYFLDKNTYQRGKWGDCKSCEQGYDYADIKAGNRAHIGIDPQFYRTINATDDSFSEEFMYKAYDWQWLNDEQARLYDSVTGNDGSVQVHFFFLTEDVWFYWVPDSATYYPFWLWLGLVGGQFFLFLGLHSLFTKIFSTLFFGNDSA